MSSPAITLPIARTAAENARAFSEFVAATVLPKAGKGAAALPEAVFGYLTMSSASPAPVSQILEQANQIYEASVALNPFLNTIIVPSLTGGDSAPAPRCFTAADLRQFATEQDRVYDYVALGGTFDRLHPGHKMLLTQASLCTASRLRVGVTGPLLLKNKKNAEMLQSFDTRRGNAERFLRALRGDLALDVVELTEKSGGTNAIAEVDAMVVSPETLPSLESINAERRERGFKDMAPILIRFVGGADNTSRISSSKLREMEIARAQAGGAAAAQ